MSDDLVKKQRPSDESNESNESNEEHSEYLQEEKDEFGMEEYGYDLNSKKKEDEQKKSDDDKDSDDEGDRDAKSREEDEEYRKRLDDLEMLRKMREEKKAKDLKIVKDREEKREEEEKKKEEQWGSDETEKKEEDKFIAGEKVEKKRFFGHKKEKGVFRHKKLFNFSTKGIKKIGKRYKKVHGISSRKKRDFLKLLEVYNPSKSVLTKKAFDNFSRRFKSKRFTGPNFDRMRKEGIDLKGARKKFGKRDLDKLRRGITGEKDPHKYKSEISGKKSSSSRNSSSRNSGPRITAKVR
ncbi:MAG: hypothetical protein U9N04_04510 [Patescibacteria group bacterium]|nr:hypothetical protein [Patescibacteria group bacterium]